MSYLSILRNNKKLTQAEVGEAIHVSASMISAWETQKISLTPVYARKLSEFYGVEIKPFEVRKMVSNAMMPTTDEKANGEQLKEAQGIIATLKSENDRLKAELFKFRKLRAATLLTADERAYLSIVLEPFKDIIKTLMKVKPKTAHEVEQITLKTHYPSEQFDQFTASPFFKEGTRYKGLELSVAYTLEDLCLFESDEEKFGGKDNA